MKLFQMKDWNVIVSEEAWRLIPFKNLLERDKSKHKIRAMAEMTYVYFFCDIKSDYLVMPEEMRTTELTKDVAGLSATWKPDKLVDEAIILYNKLNMTTIQKLYLQSLKSASAIGDYLENTKALLEERDNRDKPVNDISKITTSVQKIPKLMRDLKLAYKEVVKEQDDNENKKKGSKSFNVFEDGIKE